MHGEAAIPIPVPVRIGGLSGWLHGHGPRAVVMCGAHGFEGIAAYHSWRILADLIAARGYSVLRFDYHGEGDATECPSGTDRIDAAITGIRHATDWLKARIGASDINLVTLRLGTLLAAQALEGETITRAVHLAPLLSGRACLRELKAAARMFGTVPGRASIAADGGIDLCGFALSGTEAAGLGARSATLPLAQATFIAPTPGQDVPAPTDARFGSFDGYGAMMSLAEGLPPLPLWDEIAMWMGEPQSVPSPTVPASEAVFATPEWRETTLRFGADGGLAGVLCEPAHARAQTCVIMPNAGTNPHFGWARMSVHHARALATHGVATLRFDLSGLGDSGWNPASPRHCLYGRRHIADMRAAVDLVLARQCGTPMVSGLCSGGYLAIQAMHADARIERGVAVNVLKLVWHDTDDLDVIEREAIQASRSYGAQAMSASAWKRLIRGEIGIHRMLAVARMFARRGLRRLCELIGLETALPEDTRLIRAQFRQISQRGGRLTLVQGAMDPSRDELDLHFGTGARFACALKGVDIEIIPDTDHELTPRDARDRLQEILLDRARR